MKKFIDEASLIEGIKKKDNDAFGYLIAESYPLVFDLIRSSGASSEDVKDLIHEGIIIVYEKIISGEFRRDSSVLTFLTSICKYRWHNYLTRRKQKHVPLDSYSNLMNLANEDTQSEEEITSRAKYVSELLLRSTDRCKEILVAYYYESLSMEDIANKLGYSNAENVKNQKYKCLEKIRKAL